MPSHPLKDIANAVKAHASAGERVGAIFDLDSTLFCVSPRTQAILRDLAAQETFKKNFASVATILEDIEVLPTDWGVRSVLERHSVRGSQELYQTIRDFWRRNFFANNYLHHDSIYPSANAYVRHLRDLGAKILYLTGRSADLMHEGTVRMLRHWNFPLRNENDLYMKPNESEADETFKAKALQKLVSGYDSVYFFENEPVIIAQVRDVLPKVRIVFVDSVHAGRAAPPVGLPTISMSYDEGL